ncbi:hypothetical protein [Rickettsia endosymbiont of Halotydeus destructor]|uniref:hypothetical protein n=1 Tax=Rickettsia endosymbiont of Halotydeus destructor TaxID=2996754 RepID=UPI003BAFD2F0
MQKLVAPFLASTTVNDTIFYNIVGNFIPPEWRNLTSSKGKVLSKTSIQVLSLVVSRVQNDKILGKILEGGSDKSNELQESYYYFEQLLGVCQRRIRQCLVELEKSGYLKLTLINMTKQYIKYRNIICISLTKNFAQLNSESFGQDEFKAEPPSVH